VVVVVVVVVVVMMMMMEDRAYRKLIYTYKQGLPLASWMLLPYWLSLCLRTHWLCLCFGALMVWLQGNHLVWLSGN
jgi:hypothetical protein